jgi:hypothetical protein
MDLGRPAAEIAPWIAVFDGCASPEEAAFYRYGETLGRYAEYLAER